MNKPITPKMHAIMDYAFSGIQLLAPTLLDLNKNVVKTYQVLGTGFLGVNAMTDTPAGLKKVITMEGHQKADASFLAGLSLLTFSEMIYKDRKALTFHLAFLGTTLLHYVLTDYNGNDQLAE